MTQKPIKKYTITSLDKAINVILLLSEESKLTINDIAKKLELTLSTCYNIMNTLENRGLVDKNPNTNQYSLGLTFMRIGMDMYNDIDIRNMAIPIMRSLVNKFEETSYLTGLDHSTLEGIILENVNSSNSVSVVRSIGSRVPLYASATGNSLLAGFEKEKLDLYLSNVKLEKLSDSTITDPNVFKNKIAEIKANGYAITKNDLGDGVTSVSAPIYDFRDQVIAAISIAGPIDR